MRFALSFSARSTLWPWSALCVCFLLCLAGCGSPVSVPPEDRERGEKYVAVVREYADTVLRDARDRYGKETPLFVDGLDFRTHQPAAWPYDEERWILSNFANHQDLLRTLDGLSRLTGEPGYREEALKVTRHAFGHLRTANGLLIWGGHACYGAAQDDWVGRRHHWPPLLRNPLHELKNCYPYYPLLWEVDSKATTQFIRAFWKQHIRDWETLDFDRHGGTRGRPVENPKLWEASFNEEAPVHGRGKGRTFVNAGGDLYYSAAMLSRLGKEKGALDWSLRLAGRYVACRDPKTGLRGYQFSSPEEEDRAHAQFGDLFPDSLVRESTIFEPNALPGPLLAQLRLSEELGKAGAPFLRWAVEDLKAAAQWSYDRESGDFLTLLLDGSRLTGVPFPRDGYFGAKGRSFGVCMGGEYLLCYATAARLTNDPQLWDMTREVALKNGLGDIGARDGTGLLLNSGTEASHPRTVMALLELHRLTKRRDFLDQACRVADNLITQRYENGLFIADKGFVYARVSCPEPLALLHLAAALLGRPAGTVPPYYDGDTYFACETKSTDKAYTFDHRVIYTVRLDGQAAPVKEEAGARED